MRTFRLYGLGARFLNGISHQYSDEYPGELAPWIPESDFARTMTRINTMLRTFWPCTTMFVCGTACSPFTLTFSLCCPEMCRPEVEKRLEDDLRDISLHARYFDKGIVFQLSTSMLSSSIEILVPEVSSSRDDSKMIDIEVGHGPKES